MDNIIYWQKPDLTKYVNYERGGYVAIFQEQSVDRLRRWCKWTDWYDQTTESGSIKRISEVYDSKSVDYPVLYSTNSACNCGACDHSVNRLAFIESIYWHKSNPQNDHKSLVFHREDGPAIIKFKLRNKVRSVFWFMHGRNISDEVRSWIRDMRFPRFYNWEIEHKMAYKLAFY